MDHNKKESVELKEHGGPAYDNELAESLRNFIPNTAEEKKLVRKVDLFLMPCLWIMYILNYVDRTNIVRLEVFSLRLELTQPCREMQRLPACSLNSTSLMTTMLGFFPSSSLDISFARFLPT
jgi:hypothetical protein